MIRVAIDRSRRVRMVAAVDTALPVEEAWERISDFAWTVTRDLIHAAVEWIDPGPAAGARFVLVHRVGFVTIRRRGRILRWQPGRGFAFSDLSARGPQAGFPHAIEYRVLPAGERRSRIEIHVRGRWTLRAIPLVLARTWCAAILGGMSGRLAGALAEIPDRASRGSGKSASARALRMECCGLTQPFALRHKR
ncbi:MAG: SRPBCC family protein [Planctomycetes bacterium]|nr:SRPBCC family protein [Planctomycetota bacterium]